MVAMLDLVIGRIFASAEQELATVQAANAHLINTSLLVLRRAVGVLLDEGVPDDEVRRVAFRELTETAIRRAYDGAGQVLRPTDDRAFDFMDNHYPHLRSFLPKVLAVVPFTGTLAAQPVLQGIALLRELDAAGRRKVPADAPLGFVPAA
jgi:hypothetical protein